MEHSTGLAVGALCLLLSTAKSTVNKVPFTSLHLTPFTEAPSRSGHPQSHQQTSELPPALFKCKRWEFTIRQEFQILTNCLHSTHWALPAFQTAGKYLSFLRSCKQGDVYSNRRAKTGVGLLSTHILACLTHPQFHSESLGKFSGESKVWKYTKMSSVSCPWEGGRRKLWGYFCVQGTMGVATS